MEERTAKPLPQNPYNPHAWIAGCPEIGEGTWIGAFTLIDGLGGLKIGKGCDISCGAQILSHSTERRCVTARRYPRIDYRPTEIGDHVFVGANAVIQKGCKIGAHCVIGAGAVVLEGTEIPAYSLVVGVPARVVRDIREEAGQWSREDER
ncbi:MAG: acyltransferase [Verrucomicrobiae bacterium]|nr:acyltransferase [Verrucomicrobiae bacterium]